jgi:putative transposase
MSRPKRRIEPGVVYHLISRFVAREWFIKSETERRAYLSLLEDGIKASDWCCFAYAIMSNHIHLGVRAGDIALASWIGSVHSDFATWLNERRERVGQVFMRGPKSIAFRPEGGAQLIRYIHRNPVRAGVVADPMDCDWTSHRIYAGLERRPAWLDVDEGLALAALADAAFANPQMLCDWIARSGDDRESLDRMRLYPKVKPGRPRETERASPEEDEYEDASATVEAA